MKTIKVLTFIASLLFASHELVDAASVNGSKTTNVTIPDGSPGAWVSSTIGISGAPSGATVTGIDVSFSCVHPYSGDLVIDLNADSTGSLGTKTLWNREGGAADNPSRTTNGITTFNGLTVNRTWYLYARDYATGDSGNIDEWSITIYYNAPTTYSISPNPATVSEGAGSVTFTVSRSGGTPAETVYVSTTTTEGYSNGSDYTGINSQGLSFSSGQTSRTVSVTINDDSSVESGETFGFIVQRNSSDPVSTYLAKTTFSITDNEAATTPHIAAVNPNVIPASNNNQLITINGSGFMPGCELLFDPPTGMNLTSNPSKLTVVSSNSLRYYINNLSDAGQWTVTVINPGAISSNVYTLMVTQETTSPVLTNVTPSTVPASLTLHELEFTGSNFTAGTTLVLTSPSNETFDSRPERLTVESSGHLTYAFNNSAEYGTWTVRAVNSGSTPSNQLQIIVSAPSSDISLDTVTPDEMPPSVNDQEITLIGQGFDAGTQIEFTSPSGTGFTSVPAKLTIVSDSVLRYLFNNGAETGTWTLRAKNSTGQYSGQKTILVRTQHFDPDCFPSKSDARTAALYHDPNLSVLQLGSLDKIYDAFLEWGDGDVNKFAYIYATAYWESRLTPISEHRAAIGTETYELQENYWYTGYYGRGFVQLTWDYNYRSMGSFLGIDLLGQPDLALDPDYAAQILVFGMMNGSFTGRRLSDYINESDLDFTNARRVVNGNDQDTTIAGFGLSFLSGLPAEIDCVPHATVASVTNIRFVEDHVAVETIAPPASTYVLESSTNMKDWTEVRTFTEDDSEWSITPAFAINPQSEPSAFFRIRRLP